MQTINCGEDYNQKIECPGQKYLHRANKSNLLSGDSQTGQKEQYDDSHCPKKKKRQGSHINSVTKALYSALNLERGRKQIF